MSVSHFQLCKRAHTHTPTPVHLCTHLLSQSLGPPPTISPGITWQVVKGLMLQRSCGRSWMETCRLKPSPLNCSVLGSSSRRPPLTHSSTATAWGTGVQGRGPDELSLYNAHMGCGPQLFSVVLLPIARLLFPGRDEPSVVEQEKG